MNVVTDAGLNDYCMPSALILPKIWVKVNSILVKSIVLIVLNGFKTMTIYCIKL